MVIAQDPAAATNVAPGATVTIIIAVAPTLSVPVSVGGRWDSSSSALYEVVSLGGAFFFRRVTHGPALVQAVEQGSGSVSAGEVTAEWTGQNGTGQRTGRILRKSDKNVAQVIQWNDGVIWFRPEEEGSDLVHHYQLDQYDRATVLKAIRAEARK
jgi:hypothetical protein